MQYGLPLRMPADRHFMRPAGHVRIAGAVNRRAGDWRSRHRHSPRSSQSPAKAAIPSSRNDRVTIGIACFAGRSACAIIDLTIRHAGQGRFIAL
ncbi:MAG: hypothetical protein WCF44_18540, partial [Candidatus Methylophosphatis roskildensis]